ncbi:MAG TPA: adenylate/guanylate cyclase domain-containing protein [Alphaproteobacteria bacterium]|nr:adenylate/guanylate cyclase domain-containing protein [Alphaproteobacteria bacterium]
MLKRLSHFVLGEPLPAQLPERVRQAIARQQCQAEILISWVQIGLVVFFGAVYAISPKTAAVTTDTPVLWALGFYFLFTATRLMLAYRRAMPGWLLMGSVVVDIGLLMILIWSFHIQYGQPPSFYLKVPTMLYVFIFISMRALRFDPSYILLSGAAAALGWMVLVLYAIFAAPGNPMITMNFVEYLTSNSILVGAEVDKIMVIILVTLLIALAVTRARRLMIRSVADAIAARDLSRFVAPEIADHITSADRDIQPGDSEVGVATVMFTDIEGFSTISERIGPKNLVRALNDYFSAMNETVRRHGGVISQFQGDAMLIAFNTVRPNEKHALNAVRTAIDIQKVCAAAIFGDGVVFKTRCGINTGEVIFGAIGGAGRLLFTVHGDQVNLAARLEPLNKEYGTYVMASERTVEEAAKEGGDDFGFVKVGKVTVRGRATPTVVYAINPEPL